MKIESMKTRLAAAETLLATLSGEWSMYGAECHEDGDEPSEITQASLDAYSKAEDALIALTEVLEFELKAG